MAQRIIYPENQPIHKAYNIPFSKSISNRLLILDYLYNLRLDELNYSDANDTVLLRRILRHPLEGRIDVQDAGTVLRFLTAVLVAVNKSAELYGTSRLQERPIKGLIESLTQAGSHFKYLNKDGQAPILHIHSDIQIGDWTIEADVSSQYVSALCMIIPFWRVDRVLHLKGKIVSLPYIDSTLKVMQTIGFDINRQGQKIIYTHHPRVLSYDEAIPNDYSSVAFPILEMSLNQGSIKLPKLSRPNGWQGDEIVLNFCTYIGVKYEWEGDNLLLTHSDIYDRDLPVFDFSETPDLALPMIVALCAHHDSISITGLQTLNSKESERFDILMDLVYTLGFKKFEEKDIIHLKKVQDRFENLDINDENDHRVVMTMACMHSLYKSVNIRHTEAVMKSFPLFWGGFDSSL